MYKSKLSLMETEQAIKLVKDSFEKKLASSLDLCRVSAPLFVYEDSGLNDDLNGVERPVKFDLKNNNRQTVIVHSLAKWKRLALKRHGFKPGFGLYTDMNAIRRDEVLDNIHSAYVDQWDWEKVITKSDRNIETLKDIVRKIVVCICDTKELLSSTYPVLNDKLSKDVFFITTEELLKLYPDKTPKERENLIAKEHKTVFIMQIGKKLSNGTIHDGRAPDYDDWNLNGDIIFWYEPLNMALEVSSMGIRVDKEALKLQLELSGKTDREKLPFHKALLNDELPLSVGGGIGQSRICMLILEKQHIGEVQASIWNDEIYSRCEKEGIELL